MTTTFSATESAGDSGGGATHQLLRFARAVDEALDRVADTPAWSMTPQEQRETALLLDRVESRLSELGMRVLVAADRNEVGADGGATSTAAWLADATRQTRAHCARQVRLGLELDGGFSRTRQALATGQVNRDQARVIVDAVNLLTDEYDDLPPGTPERAEEHLLDLAHEFDAVTLRQMGKRLFEVVCPEAADQAEGDRLAKEEERARRVASLSTRDNGDGTVDGRFRLPVLHAELLKKALEALTAPRRLGAGRLDPPDRQEARLPDAARPRPDGAAGEPSGRRPPARPWWQPLHPRRQHGRGRPDERDRGCLARHRRADQRG